MRATPRSKAAAIAAHSVSWVLPNYNELAVKYNYKEYNQTSIVLKDPSNMSGSMAFNFKFRAKLGIVIIVKYSSDQLYSNTQQLGLIALQTRQINMTNFS